MPQLKVAHLREQGQDMIIIPLDQNFDYKSSADQNAALNELQMRASAAGLAGAVALIWLHGRGTKFMAPPPWHPFFRTLSLQSVWQSLNKTLSW